MTWRPVLAQTLHGRQPEPPPSELPRSYYFPPPPLSLAATQLLLSQLELASCQVGHPILPPDQQLVRCPQPAGRILVLQYHSAKASVFGSNGIGNARKGSVSLVQTQGKAVSLSYKRKERQCLSRTHLPAAVQGVPEREVRQRVLRHELDRRLKLRRRCRWLSDGLERVGEVEAVVAFGWVELDRVAGCSNTAMFTVCFGKAVKGGEDPERR